MCAIRHSHRLTRIRLTATNAAVDGQIRLYRVLHIIEAYQSREVWKASSCDGRPVTASYSLETEGNRTDIDVEMAYGGSYQNLQVRHIQRSRINKIMYEETNLQEALAADSHHERGRVVAHINRISP